MHPMALTGRTVIVTGTGQGIGRAISELVLDLGGNLVMVERNPETFAAVSAALEWARYGIRVNSVGFGTVETPMTETIRSDRFRDRTLARIPLGRIATPAEVAPLICFLLSDAASDITGQNWLEDGGSHMQP